MAAALHDQSPFSGGSGCGVFGGGGTRDGFGLRNVPLVKRIGGKGSPNSLRGSCHRYIVLSL